MNFGDIMKVLGVAKVPAYGICTWAGRPTSPKIGDHITLTDMGNRQFYWSGVVWVPDGTRPFTQVNVAGAAHTGSLTETTLATIVIPGGMVGLNGMIRVSAVFSCNASANNKTFRMRLGGVSYYVSDTGSSAAAVQAVWTNPAIRNRNSQSSQIGFPNYGSVTSAKNLGNVDTAVDQSLTITGMLTNVADNIVLEAYTIEVIPT